MRERKVRILSLIFLIVREQKRCPYLIQKGFRSSSPDRQVTQYVGGAKFFEEFLGGIPPRCFADHNIQGYIPDAKELILPEPCSEYGID